jgi:hypothetical protein
LDMIDESAKVILHDALPFSSPSTGAFRTRR